MLSISAKPYIDASVPVLRQHGLAITTLFYKNMFESHPELMNLFNMGNQGMALNSNLWLQPYLPMLQILTTLKH